jgi:hypothetical protein
MGRLLRGRVCGARLHNGRELLNRARSFVLSLIRVTADPGDNHLNGHWRERSTMIGRTGTFGAAGLAWRHRRPAYVGWISIFVLAHDAICPDESKAKDPATPELRAHSPRQTLQRTARIGRASHRRPQGHRADAGGSPSMIPTLRLVPMVGALRRRRLRRQRLHLGKCRPSPRA